MSWPSTKRRNENSICQGLQLPILGFGVTIHIFHFFFLTILFMAKWIRNNKYQPVDLISLVRSHISHLLQGNSILSNLSCQAYIEENHQSQIPNSSSWGQVLNSSNLLLPMNVPYCSVKQCLFQFFWPWASIRNDLLLPKNVSYCSIK